MELAQVVYSISNDRDFAEQWRTDPDAALAKRGLRLSKEEQAFLSMGMSRYDSRNGSKINLTQVGFGLPWFY